MNDRLVLKRVCQAEREMTRFVAGTAGVCLLSVFIILSCAVLAWPWRELVVSGTLLAQILLASQVSAAFQRWIFYSSPSAQEGYRGIPLR